MSCPFENLKNIVENWATECLSSQIVLAFQGFTKSIMLLMKQRSDRKYINQCYSINLCSTREIERKRDELSNVYNLK